MLRKLFFIAFLSFALNASAQFTFRALLVNVNDSTAMAFTNLHLQETDQYAATDEKGAFSFALPSQLQVVHLDVSAIGCHTTLISHPATNNTVQKIYVHPAVMIREVEVQGLSAKSIVKKAIAAIAANYADSAYADESFYRQYEKVNGKFCNVLEAQLTVMFNLSRPGSTLNAKESFAVNEMRRSNFEYMIDDLRNASGDDCAALFSLNPVYHLAESSLNIKAFDDYNFSFDTLLLPDAYVIDYISPDYSSESHGVGNYAQVDLKGESREYVKLVIDKSSFAIRSFERHAVRNLRYDYPKNNNFIVPSRHYTCEFVDAHLRVDYQPRNGKWYLQQILYDYTNAYFRTQSYERAAVITDAFEWHSGNIIHHIQQDMLNQFYFTPALPARTYTFHENAWKGTLPDFYFYKKDEVMKNVVWKK